MMFGNNGYYGHHGHKLSPLDNDFDTVKLQANLMLVLLVQCSVFLMWSLGSQVVDMVAWMEAGLGRQLARDHLSTGG